jgi:hypothetical protein
MNNTFAAVFLINLKRRPDRLSSALLELKEHGWPFRQPEIFVAVDGNAVPTPPGWQAGGGAWGCRMSHVAILQRCIQDGIEPVLVLEDDIRLRSTFLDDCMKFFQAVPRDWQCLMLGGQHMQTPRKVKPGVVRCSNCQRTHAYSIRGRFLRELYAQWASPRQTQHIDWNFGPMQAHYPTYAPDPFLFGQSRSMSDICGRTNPTKFWQPPSGQEPVLVLNCGHDIVKALRDGYCVHTGYDRDKDDIDKGLNKVFAAKDPKSELHKWINDLQWECISEEGMVLGIWHPKATAAFVRECWSGPVVEVRSIADAIPYLSRNAPRQPLCRTHVVLLHADKATAAMLPFLHCGYWRERVTGYDNGLRAWLEHRRLDELANIINVLAEEAESIKDGVACIWHPDIRIDEVQAASGSRKATLLEGNDYQKILQQWQECLRSEVPAPSNPEAPSGRRSISDEVPL